MPADAVDFALVTAVEVERKAVCAAFDLTHADRVRKHGRVYWCGKLSLKDGEFYQIVVPHSVDMANVDAALLTNYTIHDWDAAALILVGIAGAASKDVGLGDIVLGRSVYYYERGKVTAAGKLPEPVMYPPDATLWNNVTALPDWTDSIPVDRPDGKADRPRIQPGVIASGEKFIADAQVRDQIAKFHRKVLAIEMEGYGFSKAVWQSFEKRRHLVIRAICDHADRNEDHNWQPYAAAVVAGYARHFLKDRPLEPRNPVVAKAASGFDPGSTGGPEALEAGATASTPAGDGFEWDVFLSYRRSSDNAMADRIQEALAQRGVRVWRDKDCIGLGEIFARAIEKGLESSRAMAILVSPATMKSKWVEEEYAAAISLAKREENPLLVIPVILKDAALPPFLRSRNHLDLRDESKFGENMTRLARAVRGLPVKLELALEISDEILAGLSFLSFFPEGLMRPVYDWLVSKMAAKDLARRARSEGFVRTDFLSGIEEMAVLDPENVAAVRSGIEDEARLASELLPALEDCYSTLGVFENITEFGLGRALLLRDLISIASLVPKEAPSAEECCDRICEMARLHLTSVVEEGYARIGLEISSKLREMTHFRPEDYLSHARLLLAIGRAWKAAEIFDLYRGEDNFADLGLDELTRINVILSWCKALKDAGEAGRRHAEIIPAYGAALDLQSGLAEHLKGDEGLTRLRASILNDRGTQTAVYGDIEDWEGAREDMEAAAAIFRSIGARMEVMGCHANLVAHSLDRFDTEAPLEDLENLMAESEDFAGGIGPCEDLFFYYYQRGRLARRLHTSNLETAIDLFKSAYHVAQRLDSGHRMPIARRQVLRTRELAKNISEDDYLDGLRQCIGELQEHPEDAWAVNTLRLAYLEVANILRLRGEKKEAWDALVASFSTQLHQCRGVVSSGAITHFRSVLERMDDLEIDSELREQFVVSNYQVFREILQLPAFSSLSWKTLKDWLHS
jgi:nucleoside phosphorylase/tetratricopeptide (TPR) repeat protein